ncbi:DUF937 domain-containing protein, partial [Rhizobiaceae sp. 2RAB30]
MAGNLVSYILQILTPDVIGRIATALGLDSSKAQGVVSAAVPAILAGLGSVAAQPGGAQKIADAAQQQSGSPGNLAGMLAAGGPDSLTRSGSQIMSSLFGAKDGGALSNAIGKFAGIDQNKSGSLLQTLAPLVMGGLAQHSGGDLSANGIAGLLASQKDNIAAALPSGLSQLLGSAGLLGGLGTTARTAAATASQTAQSAASSVSSTASTAQRAAAPSASRSWIYWLIAALILAGVLFYLFGRQHQPTTPPVAATGEQNLTVGGIDVGKQVRDSLTSLQTTVTGVTDTASANAALPKLQDVAGQLDKLNGVVGQMSTEQRAALKPLQTPRLPTLHARVHPGLALPG